MLETHVREDRRGEGVSTVFGARVRQRRNQARGRTEVMAFLCVVQGHQCGGGGRSAAGRSQLASCPGLSQGLSPSL